MKRGQRVIAGWRLGPVEAEVLEHLWEAGRPLSVREVSATIAGETRAYTTVLTTLTRLAEKGLVHKIPSERASLFKAAGNPEELAAAVIRRLLESSGDREDVLSRVVEEMSREPELLRELAALVGGRAAAAPARVPQVDEAATGTVSAGVPGASGAASGGEEAHGD